MSESAEESRTHMIMDMERKLNPTWFARRAAPRDTLCKLSTAQYWDWLVYLDVSRTLVTNVRSSRTTTFLSSRFLR